MPGDETLRKTHEESDAEPIVNVDIDSSKLTPLSPEVISKQAISGVMTVRFRDELV
ncbi:hypothetical protein OH77DRAFT_1594308 [Trametes cingulata]|nr:hypothetical protein OH77DRAFT_1594308 [Trametes cingulata]